MARFKTVKLNVRVPLEPTEGERRVRLFNPDAGVIHEGPISKMLVTAAKMLVDDRRIVIEWEETAVPRSYREDGMP